MCSHKKAFNLHITVLKQCIISGNAILGHQRKGFVSRMFGLTVKI